MKVDDADNSANRTNCWDYKYNDLMGTPFSADAHGLRSTAKARARKSLEMSLIKAASSST